MAKENEGLLPQSEQARQETQLLGEIVKKLAEFNTSLAGLPDKMRTEFAGQFASIAKLSDEIEQAKRDHTARFQAIAERVSHDRARGVYSGAYRDEQTAELAGAFFAHVFLSRENPPVAAALREKLHKAGVDPSTGEKGGYLVIPQYLEGIIRNVEKYGIFEQDVNRTPATSLSGSKGKRTQGATVYYPDLGIAPTESTLKFGRVGFNLTRYSAYVSADRWMLDSDLLISLAEFIALELGYAMALAEDTNGFIGDGTSTYAKVTGVFNSANVLSVTADTGDNTFDEVIAASTKYLSKVVGALPEWADDGGLAWYLHRTIFWAYLGVRDSQNRPIADISLGTGGKPQRTIYGYTARITQVAPKLSDTGNSKKLLAMANLRRSHTLLRHTKGVELRMSDQVKFLEGLVVWVLDVMQDIMEEDGNAACVLISAAS
jgi:HK97 family phage major capsid protein